MPGAGPFKRQYAMVTVPLMPGGRPPKRGTGFLIGPRHLLTAFHVIGNKKAREPALYGEVRVRFLDPRDPTDRPHATTAAFARDEHGAVCSMSHDWALLELADEVPDAEPFHLRPLAERNGEPWRSFGYSNGTDDHGMDFSGRIISHNGYQLDCDQRGRDGRLAGLSGAPCVVDEHVVGIIINSSDPDGDGYPAEQIFFRPIVDVAERCVLTRSRLPPRPPPFVPQVTAHLKREGVLPLLPEAGRVVSLPSVSRIDERRLAPLIAEQILFRRPREAVGVLAPLAQELEQLRAEEILDFVASVWIHDEAARALADAVKDGPPRTVIALNAGDPQLGQRYVLRAGYPTASHPGWIHRMRGLPELSAEQRLDDFVHKARAELRSLLGGVGDHELESECATEAATAPLILVVPPKAPPPEAVARLHETLPMVRVVLLCDQGGLADLLARYPAAVVVRPELQAGEEASADADHRRALGRMDGWYQNLRTKAVR